MKNLQKIKKQLRDKRHKKIRIKVKGEGTRPRLSVFCSLKHTYAQLIDDTKGRTLVSANDLEFKKAPGEKKIKAVIKKQEKMKAPGGKVAVANEIGKLIAEKALAKGIKEIVFDRGGYKYHGRVKALAIGAREGGLKF